MLKKIVKYTLLGLAGLLLLALLAVASLYVPAVQNLIRRKAVAVASEKLGMDVSVGSLRLAFPLRLTVERVRIVDRADTLVDCARLSLDVAPGPLFRREVVVRSFEIDTLAAHYAAASGMDLRLVAPAFSVAQARADLRARTAAVSRIALTGGDVDLHTVQKTAAETPDSASMPPWRVDIAAIAIGNTAFALRTAPAVTELTVRLEEGSVDACRMRLDSLQATVGSVRLVRGAYSYLMAGRSRAKATEGGEHAKRQAEADTLSRPWTVRVGSVALEDNRAVYGALNHRPAAGFDPAYIALSGLDLAVDSLYNRGAEIDLRLAALAFVERSGLRVRDASGRFGMDAADIALTDFELATAYSRLQASATAGAGVLGMEPSAPLTASLAADLDTRDVALLFPRLLPAALDDRIVRMQLSAAGRLGAIGRIGLKVSSPGHLTLTADGAVRDLPDLRRMDATARFEAELSDLAFLLELLPDTALRRRVAIPERLSLSGTAAADWGTYSADATLTADPGRLAAKGLFDPERQRYEAEIRCDSFPLNRFLPADSLGRLDLWLTAQGAGFDPYLPGTRAAVRARIDRAEFRGHDYGGAELEAELADHRLRGRLADSDEALRLSLAFSGELTRPEQNLHVRGAVERFDLAELGLAPGRIGGSFRLDADASVIDGRAYAARIGLDSIEIRNGFRTDRIRPTVLSMAADRASTDLELLSGDLWLSFASPEPPDSLAADLKRSAAALKEQIRTQRVDMERLKPALPDFSLRGEARRDNILNNYLRTKHMSFGALNLRGENRGSEPVTLGLGLERFAYGKVMLDTLTLGLRQRERELTYYLRASNVPGHLDPVAQAALYGSLVGNTGQANLWQRDRAGRDRFRFGLDAAWTDSLIRVHLTPDRPVFGFEAWSVNPDNRLVYRFDKRLSADLDLTHGNQLFALHTVPGRDSLDGVRLDIAGLRIGSMLELLPEPPPVDGVLGADLTLTLGRDSLCVEGDVKVDALAYEKRRFGDVDLGLYYGQGRGHLADVRLMLDGKEALSVHGDYRAERDSPLDLTATVPEFPLDRANVFLPSDLLALSGDLHARLHAGGTPDRLRLDGGVQFADAALRVPMIGTSFRLSGDTIRIADSRVRFDDYSIYAPNRQPLTIDGSFDLADFARPTTDLALQASDFQLVNVARSEGTQVYGTAYVDLDATARGAFDELVVRGSLGLLGGTDISYVMQNSPMDVRQRPQRIVSFVSFSDLDAQDLAQNAQEVRIGGMDVLLNVDINDDVKAAVDLSANGENRIDLRGGGNLTYTMNPLGDVSFSGRYVLSGGTVRYNPPVIAQKIFDITPDSYVEWVGNIADPSFNITATETVRATVTSEDQDARSVNFDISINIRNTLDNLAVSFGLSAPEDLTMQNQLNSLTAEQRADQAMNLLIYNTYTGPGTTAKASMENPLNSFIQKELNQWAQNNLRGVDLSFGIDSYGEDDPNGQRTDYSYRLSKSFFSNRVRAVIGGKFSTDADPSQNLRENLIDDISLEYMLDKRDNMYLKLFRHTGYESILEGEITETGVGFVIRKKLLRLGNLFRPSERKREKKQRHENEKRAQ